MWYVIDVMGKERKKSYGFMTCANWWAFMHAVGTALATEWYSSILEKVWHIMIHKVELSTKRVIKIHKSNNTSSPSCVLCCHKYWLNFHVISAADILISDLELHTLTVLLEKLTHLGWVLAIARPYGLPAQGIVMCLI